MNPDYRDYIQPLNFSHQNDIEVLASLVNDLSVVLERNRAAAQNLCAVADELVIEDSSSDVGTAVGTAVADSRASELVAENASLRMQIVSQQRQNDAALKLADVCALLLQECLDRLRAYVSDKTLETLQLHRHYIKKIQTRQDMYFELNCHSIELDAQIYAVSRTLARALREASDGDCTEYQKGIVQGLVRARQLDNVLS